MIKHNILEDLFVLEMANNHLGSLDRGLKIINDFAKVVRFNNVKAAIKLQFRDVDTFIHPSYKDKKERYIQKTITTKMSIKQYNLLVQKIRKMGCIPMSTPFDEPSVDLCEQLGIEIIKIASSDSNDWILIEKIAEKRKPVIVSTGGLSLKDMDDLVDFFEHRNIPLGINHCVALYPSEDSELEMNQIDFLKERYQNHIIGFSSHEYHDWEKSIIIAYAKGARIFERHIDIEIDNLKISPYCSTPKQIDIWFKAYKKAIEICGGSSNSRRTFSEKEIKYLDNLVRGVYAKRDLPKGYALSQEKMNEDVFLAIPLLKGQISCRELINDETLLYDIKKNEPITIDKIDSPYAQDTELNKIITNRGWETE